MCSIEKLEKVFKFNFCLLGRKRVSHSYTKYQFCRSLYFDIGNLKRDRNELPWLNTCFYKNKRLNIGVESKKNIPNQCLTLQLPRTRCLVLQKLCNFAKDEIFFFCKQVYVCHRRNKKLNVICQQFLHQIFVWINFLFFVLNLKTTIHSIYLNNFSGLWQKRHTTQKKPTAKKLPIFVNGVAAKGL